MLAYVLAIAVGLSSLVLFLTAFSKSDIHHKDDFLWSGVGLFYALVLFLCANRITGSVLLGQVAAVALVISFNWQNLKLRKAIANPEKQVDLESFSITELLGGLFKGSRQPKPQPSITQTTAEAETKGATLAEAVKSLEEEVKETVVESEEINSETVESSSEEEITDRSDSQSENITTEPQKKGLSFGQIFNFDNQQSSPESKTEDDPSSTVTSTSPEITTEETEPETDTVESKESTSTTEIEVDITTKSSPDSAVTEQETISAEEIIIVPTVEPNEEETPTPESAQRENTGTDSVEKVIPEKEIEEIEVIVPIPEATTENSSESNIDSQVEEIQVEIEEIKEKDLIDVEFTPSETEEKPSTESSTEKFEQEPKSSIDDFLADLDKSVDKPSEDK